MLPLLPLSLGWALWAGGASAPAPNRQTVENATQSVFRWAGAPLTLRWALEPDFCEALSPLLWESNTLANFPISYRSNFTTCARVHSIVRDAFALWAAANPELHIVDVTARCAEERLWRPVSDRRCSESTYCIDAENLTDWKVALTQLELEQPQPGPEVCTFRTCFECDRANVMVGGFTQKNRRLGDQHAYGRVTRALTDERPLGTNGIAVYGKSVKRAFLEINMDDEYKTVQTDGVGASNDTVANCWRLDSDLCDWLSNGDANSTFDAITIIFWIIFVFLIIFCCVGCCMALHRFASNLLTGWDVDKDGVLELHEVVYVLDEFCGEICFECRCPHIHARPMSRLAGCLSILETITQTNILLPLFFSFAIVLMPIVYFLELQPCFQCKDLRSALIHQIGHLLSLDHPDGQGPEKKVSLAADVLHSIGKGFSSDGGGIPMRKAHNLTEALEYSEQSSADNLNYSCTSPYFGTVLDVAEGISGATMFKFGLTTGDVPGPGALRRCLSSDDVDGLNYLFPSCGPNLYNGSILPPCSYESPGYVAMLRLFEDVIKLCAFPFIILIGAKVVAYFFLFVEDCFASYQVRNAARIILQEAREALGGQAADGSSRASPRRPVEQPALSSTRREPGAGGAQDDGSGIQPAAEEAAGHRERVEHGLPSQNPKDD